MLTSAAYGALCFGHERDATELANRATPIVRMLDLQPLRMINSGNLGLAAPLIGETGSRHGRFARNSRSAATGSPTSGVRRPPRLGRVAVTQGEATRAAALVGAAAAHRYDRTESPVDASLDEPYFEPARAPCGKSVWEATAREGGALSFEEAIAYAIDRPPV